MTDYNELSFLRKLAREQDVKLKAYKNFLIHIDELMTDFRDNTAPKDNILTAFYQAKHILNNDLK
ncbi:hypothetical protein [Runella limosa]|uniref:hypothetical protein n=1 Tax=Runella limosa TaxID=370978 RepID=UPI00040894D1|nr:hypothetical protein [Runella limosa]